jgi:hypothetical protein
MKKILIWNLSHTKFKRTREKKKEKEEEEYQKKEKKKKIERRQATSLLCFNLKINTKQKIIN